MLRYYLKTQLKNNFDLALPFKKGQRSNMNPESRVYVIPLEFSVIFGNHYNSDLWPKPLTKNVDANF